VKEKQYYGIPEDVYCSVLNNEELIFADKTAAWIRNEKTEKVHYYCMDCAARCFGLRRYSRSKWKDCY
jgi:hypothetical protein